MRMMTNNRLIVNLLSLIAMALTLLPGIVYADEPLQLDVTMGVVDSDDDTEAKIVSEIVIPRSAAAGVNLMKTGSKSTDQSKDKGKGPLMQNEAREKGREFGQSRSLEARQRAEAAKELKRQEIKEKKEKEKKEKEKEKKKKDK